MILRPGSQAPTPVPAHPWSETDSEAEDRMCRADQVAYLAGGRLVVPQRIPCRSKAIGAVPLLKEDQLTSDVAGLEVEGEAVVDQCCLHHQAVMDNLRLGRKCSIAACNHVAAGSKGGTSLCSQHLLPEEVGKNKTTRTSTRTSPFVAVPGPPSLLPRA
eukprot:523987-Heterocapsa_arctica.AAC.1